MELYKIGTENDVRVYKKTKLGDIAFIIICVLLLLAGCFFGTTCYYRSKYTRLVEQNRIELELARARSEQYETIYRSARNTNRELGECLSRSTANIYELRILINEVRKRYEAMEDIFNSSGLSDDGTWDNDSSRISDIAE